MDIRFEKREHLQEKPDQKNLGFGKHFTDYMFVMDWDKEQGWHDAAIVPYGGIPMDPATMVLHYAQETFEGMKAYRTAEGKIQLFRPEMNARRMIKSNERLCMPGVPEEMFVEAVKALVKAQEDWVPSEPGTSLYIRPFMFATEASLGVHMAKSYKFVIITTPVGAYYAEGINPVKILVEDEYVRAVKGGTGFTKCGGNYASSIGNTDDNGDYYACVKGYEDAVYLLPKESVNSLLELKPFNLLLKIPALVNIDTLDSVDMNIGKKTYTMKLDGGDYKFGKKTVKKEKFTELYQAIQSVMLDSEIEETKDAADKEEVLTVTFHRNTEEAPEVTLKYYTYDDTYDSVEINGTEKFLVKAEDVDALVKQIKKAF